ncbi:MAG: ATP-binding protein, partial [Caulobacterales bacterium]
MLTHPTLDQLHTLGLHGMAKAFLDAGPHADMQMLSHAEWLAILLDREIALRADKRLSARMRHARLRQQATPEDVDYRSARGLDRALFQSLLSCAWIRAHEGILICGPTGVGKS